MFESFFQVRKRCSHCQVILQPYSGDEIGVIVLGHVLLVIPVLLGALIAHLYTDWSMGQQMTFIFLLMTAFLLTFYRNIKGIWISFVYLLTGLRRKL